VDRKTTVIIIFSVLLLFWSKAIGNAVPKGAIEQKKYPTDCLYSILSFPDLTKEQKIQITHLISEFSRKIKSLRNQFHYTEMELTVQWYRGRLDEDKIKTLHNDLIKLRHQLTDEVARLREVIYTTLSPKERDEFKVYYNEQWDLSTSMCLTQHRIIRKRKNNPTSAHFRNNPMMDAPEMNDCRGILYD